MQSSQPQSNFCLFATDKGHSAILWHDNQLTGLFLPEAHPESLLRHIMSSCNSKQSLPTPAINKAILQIQNYFAGKAFNFSRIKLDFSRCPAFHQRVYAELQKIPPGCTASYKTLAISCENPNGSRAVGQAVGRNPLPLLIPCHRVINSDLTLGGFSAAGGIELKISMLELESLEIVRKPRPAIAPPLLLSQVDLKTALNVLGQADSDLKKLINVAPEFNIKIDSMTSTFQALLEAIVYQQLTGKAAATIFNRVLGLFGCKGSVSPLDIIRARDAELRSAGLSGAKIAAARDLAEFAISGRLPDLKNMQKMSNAQIINCLTGIRGIGRWTVEMLLIFKLGRADIMAANDYGLQKGLAIIRGQKTLPGPKDLEEQAKAWRPYRSIAAWYLWRAAEMYSSLD